MCGSVCVPREVYCRAEETHRNTWEVRTDERESTTVVGELLLCLLSSLPVFNMTAKLGGSWEIPLSLTPTLFSLGRVYLLVALRHVPRSGLGSPLNGQKVPVRKIL